MNGCTLFHKGNNPKSRNIDGSKPTISAYQQNAEAPAILGQVEAEGRKEISGDGLVMTGSSGSGSLQISENKIHHFQFQKKSTWSDESCWGSSNFPIIPHIFQIQLAFSLTWGPSHPIFSEEVGETVLPGVISRYSVKQGRDPW